MKGLPVIHPEPDATSVEAPNFHEPDAGSQTGVKPTEALRLGDLPPIQHGDLTTRAAEEANTRGEKSERVLYPRSSEAPRESFCPLDKDLSWKSACTKRCTHLASTQANGSPDRCGCPSTRSDKCGFPIHPDLFARTDFHFFCLRYNLPMSCLSWNWRRRSSVKITERTHEKRAKALHRRREGCHPETALVG